MQRHFVVKAAKAISAKKSFKVFASQNKSAVKAANQSDLQIPQQDAFEFLKTLSNDVLEELYYQYNTRDIEEISYCIGDSELIQLGYTQSINSSSELNDDEGRFERVDTKQVQDYDGFVTDYTLWHDLSDDSYFCIFGDRDVYTPDNSERDFETDTYDAAIEWFNLYEGPGAENDDIYSCDDPNCHDCPDDVKCATAEELQSRMNQYTKKQSEVGDRLDGLKNRAKRGFGKNKVMSADEEFDLPQVDQKFSSKKTAVNGRQGKLPAIFKLVTFPSGTINLDYGGGTEDAQAVADAYFEDKGVTNLIYDVYNQTPQHNREVVKQIRSNGGADTATLSNVLNVIAEPESRLNVLTNIKNLLKSNGTLYITVYEGAKANRGAGKQTGEDQFQTNMALADYLEEVQQVFPNAKKKGKLIIAPNGGTVSGSTDLIKELEIPGLSEVYATDGVDVIDITEVYNVAADTLDPNAGDVGTFVGPSNVLPEEHFSIVQYDVGMYYVYIDSRGLIVSVDSETGEVLNQADSIADFCEYVERINRGTRQMKAEYEGQYSANACSDPDCNESIEAAFEPEPNLDPPEYDEPEQLDDNIEQIEIPFDCIIVLNEDGWDYEDETYEWAAGPDRNGAWYSAEHGVFLGDRGTMVECIDDLLMTRLPEGSGRYHITGTAVLAFNVSGVDKYSDFEGLDEDGDPIFDETYNTEYADARFDIQNSTIENFTYEPAR